MHPVNDYLRIHLDEWQLTYYAKLPLQHLALHYNEQFRNSIDKPPAGPLRLRVIACK
jgi:hypothetical protein